MRRCMPLPGMSGENADSWVSCTHTVLRVYLWVPAQFIVHTERKTSCSKNTLRSYPTVGNFHASFDAECWRAEFWTWKLENGTLLTWVSRKISKLSVVLLFISSFPVFQFLFEIEKDNIKIYPFLWLKCTCSLHCHHIKQSIT